MLPRGFVHPRKGGEPNGFPKPIVEKMQERSKQRSESKADESPKGVVSFHRPPRKPFYSKYIPMRRTLCFFA